MKNFFKILFKHVLAYFYVLPRRWSVSDVFVPRPSVKLRNLYIFHIFYVLLLPNKLSRNKHVLRKSGVSCSGIQTKTSLKSLQILFFLKRVYNDNITKVQNNSLKYLTDVNKCGGYSFSPPPPKKAPKICRNNVRMKYGS